MTEVFLPVAGHHDYLVSSEGRVFSHRTGRYLVPSPDSHGYLRVTLDGRTLKVHVLVAEAFLGPRPAGMHVCHGPAGQQVNSLVNLRYGTQRENEQDKKKKRKRIRKGSQGSSGDLSVPAVVTLGGAACRAS